MKGVKPLLNTPVENCWKPVLGENFMMINCLWVSGKFKGQGISNMLLDECIADAGEKEMGGVAVVVSSKSMPFLTDKKYYQKKGFLSTDSAKPYFELMTLTFNEAVKKPFFSKEAKSGEIKYKNGIVLAYSNQCPFMEEYTGLLAEISKEKGIDCEIIKIEDSKSSKKLGSPFGTLGIYYKGEFKTHILMSGQKFEKFLLELI